MLLGVLLAFIIILSDSKCPKSCESTCSIPGDRCNSCLKIFFQVYSLNLKTCVCRPGFTHFLQSEDYCCPFECQSCGTLGCSSCDLTNSQTIIHYADFFRLQFFNCSCIENFYQDTITHKCKCLSQTNPTNYYSNKINGNCLKCPQGCQCSELGCIKCDNSTNRKIQQLLNTSYNCQCIHNYHQIDGLCSCPKDCLCSQDKLLINCLQDSHRIAVLQTWICKFPFTEVNGECVCRFPYSQNYLTKQCVCSSQTVTELKANLEVYRYEDICYQCLGGCTCNYRGCLACPSGGKYLIQNGTCFCSQNYTKVINTCLCRNPYYEVSEGDCRCMSQLNNSLYYYNSDYQSCHKCPEGCQCSQIGCYECSFDSLRIIMRDLKNQYICRCGINLIQNLQGTCLCISPFIQSNNRCICNNNTQYQHDVFQTTLVFFNIDLNQCIVCPRGCTCNKDGCSFCINLTLRQISKNSEHMNSCNCIINSYQNKFKICECIFPFTLNIRSLSCECQEPYYLDGAECLCKSKLFPTEYFWNFIDKQCLLCPQQCICNSFGCVSCTNDSLRYIVSINTSTCQCYQQTIIIDNKCTLCTTGYFYDNQCIPCYGCQTCNRSGCLSCDKGLILQGFQCICEDSSLINWNGTCICREGTYNSSKQCIMCPMKCRTCEIFTNDLLCTSCYENMNRLVQISSQCDCIEGYQQTFPMQQYCCKSDCSECNSKGCTECFLYSFRTLVDGQCKCIFPFIDTGNHYCKCLDGYYLLLKQCLSCPANCKTCRFQPSNQTVVCLSCLSQSNRNIKSPVCKCLDGFNETIPGSTFCVPMYCISNTVKCTQCIEPRIIQSNKCICPNGYYESYIFTCLPCYIKGCLTCLLFDICTQCNVSDDYYLTGSTCTKRNLYNYLYSYQPDHSGIVVQFQMNEHPMMISYVQVNIYSIGTHSAQTQFDSPTLLSVVETVHKFILSPNDIITLIFPNTKITHQNVMMSFVINYTGYQQLSQINTTQYSLLHKTVYSDTLLTIFKYTPYCVGAIVYVFSMMLIAFIIHVSGFKHNQIMFTLHTMSYCVFALYRPSLQHISILYYLRFSYLGFGTGPFINYLPDYYMEAAPRNYRFLTKDANFIRVAGIPFIITVILIIIIFVLRFCYYLSYNSKQVLDKQSKHSIKVIYRILEFSHKVMMYPMIFFSIQTFFNWDIYHYTDSSWRIISRIILTVIFVYYFIVTVIQLKYENIPRSSRIQIINQYLSTIITSIFIISNQNVNINQYLLALAIPLIIRDLVYIYNLYKYCEYIFYSYLVIFLPTFLQILPLVIMIFCDNRSLLFGAIILLNISQILVPVYVMRVLYIFLKIDKVTVTIIEKAQDITGKYLADITDNY